MVGRTQLAIIADYYKHDTYIYHDNNKTGIMNGTGYIRNGTSDVRKVSTTTIIHFNEMSQTGINDTC